MLRRELAEVRGQQHRLDDARRDVRPMDREAAQTPLAVHDRERDDSGASGRVPPRTRHAVRIREPEGRAPRATEERRAELLALPRGLAREVAGMALGVCAGWTHRLLVGSDEALEEAELPAGDREGRAEGREVGLGLGGLGLLDQLEAVRGALRQEPVDLLAAPLEILGVARADDDADLAEREIGDLPAGALEHGYP